MKYILIDKSTGTEGEISYADAKDRISHYCSTKEAADMLSKPRTINLMFSKIRVIAK